MKSLSCLPLALLTLCALGIPAATVMSAPNGVVADDAELHATLDDAFEAGRCHQAGSATGLRVA